MPGNPFNWNAASTANVAVSNANARVPLVRPSNGPSQIRVLYVGTGTVFIRRDTDGTGVADVTVDMPVAAGQPEVLTLNNGIGNVVTNIDAITAGADAGKLYVTTGDGF